MENKSIKIATKREALWIGIKERMEADMKSLDEQEEISKVNIQRERDVSNAIKETAERIIKEENAL